MHDLGHTMPAEDAWTLVENKHKRHRERSDVTVAALIINPYGHYLEVQERCHTRAFELGYSKEGGLFGLPKGKLRTKIEMDEACEHTRMFQKDASSLNGLARELDEEIGINMLDDKYHRIAYNPTPIKIPQMSIKGNDLNKPSTIVQLFVMVVKDPWPMSGPDLFLEIQAYVAKLKAEDEYYEIESVRWSKHSLLAGPSESLDALEKRKSNRTIRALFNKTHGYELRRKLLSMI